MAIRDAKGCLIEEISVKRSGRRFDADAIEKQRGGSRQKKSKDSQQRKISGSIHSDDADVRNDNIQHSVMLFHGVPNNDNIVNEIDNNKEIETGENNNNGEIETQNL